MKHIVLCFCEHACCTGSPAVSLEGHSALLRTALPSLGPALTNMLSLASQASAQDFTYIYP